jgi:hypothetical protein
MDTNPTLLIYFLDLVPKPALYARWVWLCSALFLFAGRLLSGISGAVLVATRISISLDALAQMLQLLVAHSILFSIFRCTFEC